ncbi:Smith-Magenis syndrome chromosomal region candidate -like protein [Trichinella papuae]|uniref:Smith-Magenis syndrome chromosomal region candidate-like protein n=1 Tax=Trichinella papuae TaxID=268474 RepID=A0A0V1N341_9BILA|nr:Smith-Magenis syndrome chromosomal region candidate -like protein [Trichinella papuae]
MIEGRVVQYSSAGSDDTQSESPREIAVLADLDSLLSQAAAAVDPWHSLSAIEDDCLMLVEFSEVEGPRPAFSVPPSPGIHFDQDAFAVWLMTADYQRSGCNWTGRQSRGSVDSDAFRAKDTQMLLRNDEQGVFAFVHHFTLYELEARGFVRPFCLAYVCRDQRKLVCLFDSLRADFEEKLIEPVKACNKRQFLKQLTEALDALNTIQSQAVSAYYELCYDSDAPKPAQLGDHSVPAPKMMRHRRLHSEMLAASRLVSAELRGCGSACSNSHHLVDADAFINSLDNSDLGVAPASPAPAGQSGRRDWTTLAPCVFANNTARLICRRLLSKYYSWSPSLPFHLMTHLAASSSVRLGSVPVVYYPHCAGTVAGASGRHVHPETTLNGSNAESFHRLRTGWSCSEPKLSRSLAADLGSSLEHILYSLLTGKFVLVSGADPLQASVLGWIDALKHFVPTVYSSPPVKHWHQGRLPATALVDYKLFGLRVPKSQPTDQLIADNVAPFISRLDLNRRQLTAHRYRGQLLSRVVSRARFHGRSDRTFVPYAVGALAQQFALGYVLMAFLRDGAQAGDKQCRLRHFSRDFQLEMSDLKIVHYIADLLCSQTVDWNLAANAPDDDSNDSGSFNNALQALVFDYEELHNYKLQ